MKNSIKISVEFSFKGENFKPTVVLDLDSLSGESAKLSNLHNTLALQNNIDTYSYAFEVMEQSVICFSDATGLACDCLEDGCFDLQSYIELRGTTKLDEQLDKIARDTLGLEDLSSVPAVKEALLQAFKLGKSDTQIS